MRRSLIQSTQVPFESLISDERVQTIFDEEGLAFGQQAGAVFTPGVTLWAMLSQMLYTGVHRSCAAAVARVANMLELTQGRTCSINTGAYTRAKNQMTHDALRRISREVALATMTSLDRCSQLKEATDSALGDIPIEGNIYLVDGFTVTASDTPENQQVFPQSSKQAPGLGFPIIRVVGLMCLRTAAFVDGAFGPYAGKETGETALLRQLLDNLEAGDVIVADSYYCTYWLLAESLLRKVKVVMRNHHRRPNRPKDAIKLNGNEHLATWKRPPMPDWMDEEEYEKMPEQIQVRMIDSNITQPGWRTQRMTLVTTMLDGETYSAQSIAAIYHARWHVEVDIRAIKVTMGLDVLRSKTPDALKRELWSGLLVYNLTCQSMHLAAIASGRPTRSLSFATSLQALAGMWMLGATQPLSSQAALRRNLVSQQTAVRVGHRPNRVEPRGNKRRPKVLALLTKPRNVAREELRNKAA